MIDNKVLGRQRELLFAGKDSPTGEYNIEPLKSYIKLDKKPFDPVLARQTGALLIAGGMGSRLGFDKPKGMFPISNIKGKTLFQLFAEKVCVASELAQKDLPLAIMVSPQHYGIVLEYFKENNYFGLNSEQVDVFVQDDLPYLNDDGDVVQYGGDVLLGPSGNGGSLRSFCRAGLLDKWNEKGVCYINFVPVDNPLADPYDTNLVREHVGSEAEITVKTIERSSSAEKVGLLCLRDGRPSVIEYNEIGEEDTLRVSPEGGLFYNIASISLFCFSLSFLKKVSEIYLPWHFAHKQVETDYGKIWAWKFEEFIFDILAYTDSVAVVVCSREDVFSPLKQLSGEGSVESVQRAIFSREMNILADLKIRTPNVLFELSQDYYYNKNIVPQMEVCKEGVYLGVSL